MTNEGILIMIFSFGLNFAITYTDPGRGPAILSLAAPRRTCWWGSQPAEPVWRAAGAG